MNTNSTQPAFPIFPVQDKFGQIQWASGQTKVEYLAAQLFVELFKELRYKHESGVYENDAEFNVELQSAIQSAYMTANLFYSVQIEIKPELTKV